MMVDSNESNITRKGNNRNRNKNTGISSKRLVFLICLVIAVLFWLLIKLSDVYTVEYSFRINYISIPDSMELTNAIDSTLDLNLTARGFTILKLNLFDNMNRLDINLSNYSIDRKSGNNYAIYTDELTNNLSELINVDIKDLKFSKSILNFELDKTHRKTIKVIADYTISFSNQYDLYRKVEVDPAEINIYGPRSVLDSITEIRTNKLILNNQNANTVNEVSLKNPMPGIIKFDPDVVTLKVDVEKFTEAELSIPINVSDLPYKIKTFPSQVKVYFKVAQKDFSNVKENQFGIVPVSENIDFQLAKKLPLRCTEYPDVVRNIRIIPGEVEFLIIK